MKIFLIAIVLVRLFVAINGSIADKTIIHADTWRDYLIAEHIIKYQEFPALGPYNTILGGRFFSPIYHYVLAVFVWMWSDIGSLYLVNVVCQILSLILIYLITLEIYNKLAAFFAVILVVWAHFFLEIIAAYYHPWLTIPLTLLGFLLFIKATKKNRSDLLLASAIVITCSAVLHNSGFLYLPLILSYIYFKKRSVLKKSLLWIGLIVFVAYLPPLLYFIGHHSLKINLNLPKTLGTFFEWLSALVTSPWTFLSFISGTIPLFLKALLLVLLGFCVKGRLIYDKVLKNRLLLLTLFLLQPVMISSVLGVLRYDTYFRYTTAGYFLIAVLFSVLISQSRFKNYAKAGLFILAIYFFSQGRTITNAIKEVNNVVIKNDPISEVIYEYAGKNDFQLITYQDRERYNLNEAMIWANIEDRSGRKYVSLDNSDPEGFRAVNDDTKLIFLVCMGGDCIEEEKNTFSDFNKTEKIFSDNQNFVYAVTRGN